jgi:hypothetical protein
MEHSDDMGSETVPLEHELQTRLSAMIAAVRTGRPSVLIVQDSDEQLRYMLSKVQCAEAIAMIGTIVERAGRCLSFGDER